MSRTALIAFAFLAACTQKAANSPPTDKFYFPSGVHHDPTPGPEGTLYVVSANFDRRYDTGLMTAVNLNAVGLPPMGGVVDGGGPLALTDIKVMAPSSQTVALASFGADLGVLRIDGGVRMFIPSRAEGQKLMTVDGHGANVDCVTMFAPDGGALDMEKEVNPRDCGQVGASLVAEELSESGIPRADSPLTATVSPTGIVWVTAGRQADSPRFSQTNYSDYVVRMPASQLRVQINDFLGLGPGSTHAVVAGKRWTYFSGRFPGSIVNPPLVRMVDDHPTGDAGFAVIFPNLEADLHIGDARGIALSSDERRLFVAGRQLAATGSDLLVVANIDNPLSDIPLVTLTRTVAVPTEPQMIKTISRGPGRGDLVVVVSSGAGAMVIYDDERGDIVAQIEGLGLQPGSFAVDNRGTSARIYVTNFTDGRVAVVDVPDLDSPQSARIVAHLGASQVCLTRSLACDAGVAP